MTKQKKLRNIEYYGLQETLDGRYEKSKNGATFDKLMELTVIIRSDRKWRNRQVQQSNHPAQRCTHLISCSPARNNQCISQQNQPHSNHAEENQQIKADGW